MVMMLEALVGGVGKVCARSIPGRPVPGWGAIDCCDWVACAIGVLMEWWWWRGGACEVWGPPRNRVSLRRSTAAKAPPTPGRGWFEGWYNSAPISWTNRGYNCSVIFSLLAKSRARSNGILGSFSKTVYKFGYQFTYQTPLRCIGPILTTCLVFSLLRMPSRRPRVIPATFRSFVPLIIWLSTWTFSMTKAIGKTGMTYLLVELHRHPSLQPGSKDFLHLPTMSLLP